ncbi:ANTAR domain-containing protein [Streptomyces sp. NRRL S-920]|uniref:ANTAR domain-containing protein n=1 Tax=Streptomyces sp. NRRL S-920 TaxID=1463921 RepID=UPI0004C8B21E|nr:ANTAR domain-containing protein [Streptomyces sp. NRRL S-920]
MEQKVTIQEDRWMRAGEVAWGDDLLDPAVVELRAEIARLRRGLSDRAVIDQALGMMMALVPCPHEQAGDLLMDVARRCGLSRREVAVALVATSEGSPFPEHLDHALRGALRRLHRAEGKS